MFLMKFPNEWRDFLIAATILAFVVMNAIFWLTGLVLLAYWLIRWFLA